MNLRDRQADLTITEDTLVELKRLAHNCTLDLSHLSYPDTQYTLILWALARYIESYGLFSPFEVKLKNGRQRHNSSPNSPDTSD